MSQLELDNYQKTQSSIDELIELKAKQLKLIHKLKLSLFREQLVKTHDNEYWIDEIPKPEAKKLFHEFLILWKNAFGEAYDHYEHRSESNHFENFKAVMIWDYRKNKTRLNKTSELPIRQNVKDVPEK